MQSFTPSSSSTIPPPPSYQLVQPSTPQRQKKKKEPAIHHKNGAPKISKIRRTKNCFLLYLEEHLPNHKKQHPALQQNMRVADISRQWRSEPAEVKDAWRRKAYLNARSKHQEDARRPPSPSPTTPTPETHEDIATLLGEKSIFEDSDAPQAAPFASNNTSTAEICMVTTPRRHVLPQPEPQAVVPELNSMMSTIQAQQLHHLTQLQLLLVQQAYLNSVYNSNAQVPVVPTISTGCSINTNTIYLPNNTQLSANEVLSVPRQQSSARGLVSILPAVPAVSKKKWTFVACHPEQEQYY